MLSPFSAEPCVTKLETAALCLWWGKSGQSLGGSTVLLNSAFLSSGVWAEKQRSCRAVLNPCLPLSRGRCFRKRCEEIL